VIVPEVTEVRFPELKRRVWLPEPVILRSVNFARPVASVVAVKVPPRVPVPEAIETVTTMPLWLIVAFEPSRSWIHGCWAKGVLLTAAAEGCWVMVSWVAAVPEARKLTGLPLRGDAVAVAVLLLVPEPDPTVQLVAVAIPFEPVVTVLGPAGTMVPPPAVTAKVTAVPETGLPLASVTITEGGPATAVLTVAVWVVAEFAAIVAGAPAVTVTLLELAAVSTGLEVNCNT